MSITLTNPFTLSGSITENDTIGGCSSMMVDFINQSVTFTLKEGILSNGNLAPGALSPQIYLIVNLVTGAWITQIAGTSAILNSGTIPGASLTNFNSQMKAIRNLVETFAAGASAIMPGTQVPW